MCTTSATASSKSTRAPAPGPKIATSYSYDHRGNLIRVIRATGDPTDERVVDYAYDGLNRARREFQYVAWPTPVLTTQYIYDGNGNRTAIVDPLGRTTTLGYDSLNRLTSIVYADGVTPSVTYSYDRNRWVNQWSLRPPSG